MADIRSHVIKEADKPTDRRQDIIHPSEMGSHDWCPRATYYRIRDVRAGKPYKGEKFQIGTLSIFEEGHHIHAKWQGWLREMGRLKGRWDCTECQRKGIAWPDDPCVCPLCGSVSGVKYGEVPLDALKEHLIGGHADGWVGDGLIEIKSIGKGTLRMDVPQLYSDHTHTTDSGKTVVDIDGLWDAINRPLPPHVKQGNIYLYICQLMGIPVDYMEFLYEFKANQQTKSFKVKLSPSVINPLLEKADSIKNGLETGNPPERAFSKPDKSPCKNCPWLKECYEEDSPEPEPRQSRRRRARRAEGQEAAGRTVRPRGSRRSSVEAPERPHRGRRVRPDDAVRRDDRLGELPRDEAVAGSGRREVRRVRAGDPPSRRGARQGDQDRQRGEGARARQRRGARGQ